MKIYHGSLDNRVLVDLFLYMRTYTRALKGEFP